MSARPPAVDATRPAGPAEILAGIVSAGSCVPSAAAALASLSAVRGLSAEIELGELVLIEAARRSGATWSEISAALGTRNRQTAQKRHADLARRFPRPPAVDIPGARPAPVLPDTRPGRRQPGAGSPEGEDAPSSDGQLPGQLQLPLALAAGPGPAASPLPPGSPGRAAQCEPGSARHGGRCTAAKHQEER